MKIKKEKRHNRQYTDAREVAKRQSEQIQKEMGCDFIQHFNALAKAEPGISVVVLGRVSDRSQRDNLSAKIAGLREAVESKGGRVVATIRDVCSGKIIDRKKLRKAIRIAKKKNAIILTESVCRYIRSEEYSKTNQGAIPTADEFDKLRNFTKGVTLATLTHPGIYTSRSTQTRWGQKASEKKLGRPQKALAPSRLKTGRPKKLTDTGLNLAKLNRDKARWMLQIGGSITSTAECLKVSRKTVHSWKKGWEKESVTFPELKPGPSSLHIVRKQ